MLLLHLDGRENCSFHYLPELQFIWIKLLYSFSQKGIPQRKNLYYYGKKLFFSPRMFCPTSYFEVWILKLVTRIQNLFFYFRILLRTVGCKDILIIFIHSTTYRQLRWTKWDIFYKKVTTHKKWEYLNCDAKLWLHIT